METASFSETLASTNQFTWHLNPKEHHQKWLQRLRHIWQDTI
jgi:hypothetical protein